MKLKIIILLLLVLPKIRANTYFVSIHGDDSNPGTEMLPWKTIQKAANILSAGDTLYVKAGVYNERVVLKNSGTPNNDIVFARFQNDTVIIDGYGISWGNAWNGLFDISDKSNIQIIGFSISNADYAGIWVENSNHVTISDNYTYNTFSSGIGVWNSSFITILNNEIELACNNGEQECITISNSYNCTIKGNNVHHNGMGTNGGEGIDVKQGSHDIDVFQNVVHHLNERIGIYTDAWDSHTYNINVYQNVVHDCGNNGMVVQSEMGGLIEYVSFYNNIIYHNKYDGIAVGSVTASDTVSSTPVRHINISNNTIYQNGSYLGGWAYGILVDNPDANDVIIRNNICYRNDAQIAIQQLGEERVVDHNLIFGNNAALGSLYGSDSIIGNPLFVDSSTYNFHLLSTSPAIDRGSPIDVPDFDFDDNSRPLGEGFDIGAFEYSPTSILQGNIDSIDFVKIYPNPVTDIIYVIIKKFPAKDYTFEFYDLNGRLVKNMLICKKTRTEIFIDKEEIIPGLYFLRILSNNKVISNKKLIIE